MTMIHSRECALQYGDPCDCGAKDEAVFSDKLPFTTLIDVATANRSWCGGDDLYRDGERRNDDESREMLKRMKR